jgi:phosphohistidine phosphatase SixA
MEDQSQNVLDPPLTKHGEQMATDYSAPLQAKLRNEGIDLDTAFIGASQLKRAQQTAQRLFPSASIQIVPHFTENGVIPENTPVNGLQSKPNWPAALRFLAKTGHSQMIVVGHGSYLRHLVWPTVSKRPSGFLANMDAIVIDALLSPQGRLSDIRVKRIRYDGTINIETPGDQCSLLSTRRKTRKQKSQKQKNQKSQTGGFTPAIMGGFAAAGSRLLPVATYFGYKLATRKSQETRKTRKTRKQKA